MSQTFMKGSVSRVTTPGRYSTSKGTVLFERGPHNPIPDNNYLSGDGKSHVYQGPGYYVPSELRWISYHEYRSLPPETRRDAILFENEDDWRAFQRKRDKPTNPGGISLSGHPSTISRTPVQQLVPFQGSGYHRHWTGPGFYLTKRDKWMHEHNVSAIPVNSYLFYNEEDWLKFKHQVENPDMNTDNSVTRYPINK